MDVRTILRQEFDVCFPESLDNKLDAIVIPGCFDKCIDHTFSLKSEKIAGKCLQVCPTIKLNEYEHLLMEVTLFLKPLQDNRPLWLHMDRFQVLKIYINSFLDAEREKQQSPIETLSNALFKTQTHLKGLLEGSLSYGQCTVNGKFKARELDMYFRIELEQINSLLKICGTSDEVALGISAFSNYIELLQIYQYISMVSKVCERYDMTACLDCIHAENLAEIVDTVDTPSKCKELSPQTALLYLTKVKRVLHLDDTKEHMVLFKNMLRCRVFYDFVVDQFFPARNETELTNGIRTFRAWYEIISNQLQNVEFEENVLLHLSSAFDCILPFVKKNQTLDELIISIKALDSSNQYCELLTVCDNMHNVQRWSSQAEVSQKAEVAASLQE